MPSSRKTIEIRPPDTKELLSTNADCFYKILLKVHKVRSRVPVQGGHATALSVTCLLPPCAGELASLVCLWGQWHTGDTDGT